MLFNTQRIAIAFQIILFVSSLFLFLQSIPNPIEDRISPTAATKSHSLADSAAANADVDAAAAAAAAAAAGPVQRLVIGVTSTLSDDSIARRQAIRDTWWNLLPYNYRNSVKLRFFIGQPSCLFDYGYNLSGDFHQSNSQQQKFQQCKQQKQRLDNALSQEHKRYGDIVQLPVPDDYEHLASKTFHFIHWVQRNFKFDYLLKTDEDVFLRIDTILEELEQKPRERYWYGWVWHFAAPVADRSHKNFEGNIASQSLLARILDAALEESERRKSQSTYIGGYGVYVTGLCVVWSQDIIRRVLAPMALDQPSMIKNPFTTTNFNHEFVYQKEVPMDTLLSHYRFYRNEDVSMAMWINWLGFNIEPQHDSRLQFLENVCFDSMIAKHPVTPAEMRQLNENLIQRGSLCAPGTPITRGNCGVGRQCQPGETDWRDFYTYCREDGCRYKPKLELDRERKHFPHIRKLLPVMHSSCALDASLQDFSENEATTNLLQNANFAKKSPNNALLLADWHPFGAGYAVEVASANENTHRDHAEDRSYGMSVENQSPSESRGAYQNIRFTTATNDDSEEPNYYLVLSGWSKASDVSGSLDKQYSIFAEVTYVDGTHTWGYNVSFETGTHDWQWNFGIFEPEKHIRQMTVYAMFAGHSGKVWFDDIVLTPFSKGGCNVAHFVMSIAKSAASKTTQLSSNEQYAVQLPSLREPIVATQQQSTDDVSNPLDVIMIWTTQPSTFRLRHRRSIESIFFHHRNARVRMFSNTLPEHFFYKFEQAGYNISVVPYNLKELAHGLPGREWLQKIDQWKQGKYFYAHSADFLRFILLYKFGGFYTDTDSILLRPITFEATSSPILGTENCEENGLDFCFLSPFKHDDPNRQYTIPIGVMWFPKAGSRFLLKVLTKFDTIYKPEIWGCGTRYASLTYKEMKRANTEAADIPTLLPTNAFYPIWWNEAVKYFSESDDALWKRIKSESQAIHFWNKLTSDTEPIQNSVFANALSEFAVSKKAVYTNERW